MTRKTTLLLALGVLGCCGALNASALAQVQPMPPMREMPPPQFQRPQVLEPQAQYDRGMPFDDVIALVRSMDLDPVTAPIRRGARYVVRAVDQYGNLVRVVVDGQLARIVAMRPMRHRARDVGYAAPGYGPPPGWRQQRDDDIDIDVNIDDDVRAPKWGGVRLPPAEVPSARADAPAMRPGPGPQARLSPAPMTGPNVIYADPNRVQEPLPTDQIHESARPHASGIGRSLSIAKPPLPRARPEQEHAALQPSTVVTPPLEVKAMPEVKAETPPPPAKVEAAVAPPAPSVNAEPAPAEPTPEAKTKAETGAETGASQFPPVQPPF